MDLGFIEIYLNSFKTKQVRFETLTDNPILDLIYKYDVTNLDIGMIRFQNSEEIFETDKFIIFGKFDSDILAIEKDTTCFDISLNRLYNFFCQSSNIENISNNATKRIRSSLDLRTSRTVLHQIRPIPCPWKSSNRCRSGSKRRQGTRVGS